MLPQRHRMSNIFRGATGSEAGEVRVEDFWAHWSELKKMSMINMEHFLLVFLKHTYEI